MNNASAINEGAEVGRGGEEGEEDALLQAIAKPPFSRRQTQKAQGLWESIIIGCVYGVGVGRGGGGRKIRTPPAPSMPPGPFSFLQ